MTLQVGCHVRATAETFVSDGVIVEVSRRYGRQNNFKVELNDVPEPGYGDTLWFTANELELIPSD